MFLEQAITFGALAGAALAARMPKSAIAVIFGLVLVYSAYLSNKNKKEKAGNDSADRLATLLKMDSSYPTPQGPASYHVHAISAGFSLMFLAGILSGLLGIGSGAVKVLAMDEAMHIPFKVSTTTSNFMIGVTAAASAGIYLGHGFIDPGLAMPVVLGVLPGSMIDTRILLGAKVKLLRLIFGAVIFVLGIEMIYNGLTGKL